MTPELDVYPGAFPHRPPPDLDSAGPLVEHDWQAFTAVEQMTNHWARPGWTEGYRAYYWMLTFPDAADLLSRAKVCQDELAHLGMDPVPEDGLHVTMTRIGSTTLVSNGQVRFLADLAQELPCTTFQIAAHPLAGSRGAVRFSLAPWSPLVCLHAALSEIGQRVGVPGGKPTAAFRPHLGVQYSNRERPAAPVIESVARLRGLEPVSLEISSVELVELRRTTGALPTYRWRVVRSVPLRPRSDLPTPSGQQQG
ncbi:2'-5' RNA ligase family protein [Streptomyces sp. MZ04]|uniref:2'-5' RNA ligase family protein n=1 Tax=Streptomyces sp. MZ04 TaxID=2559236 RepID=UPI00107E93F0|nr:2'-5' RNA ligase family protein [Streptomyces sp. MZ04]TGB15525.1 2'-5' RNA ligase family protein [Streptomyces sp. MZ04]